MKEVGIADLKNDLSRYLALVRAGSRGCGGTYDIRRVVTLDSRLAEAAAREGFSVLTM